MDQVFLDFLNSLGVGKIVSICVVGCPILWGVFMAIKKCVQAYNQRIEKKALKQKDEEEFHASMVELGENVKQIQQGMSDLSESQNSTQDEMNSKINDMWETIVQSQQDSKDGDIALEKQINGYESKLDDICTKLNLIEAKSNLLIESDRETIKSYITEKYYDAHEKGYIELRVMDSLESIYANYLKENGNTFIGSLMDDLRKMGHEPPKK